MVYIPLFTRAEPHHRFPWFLHLRPSRGTSGDAPESWKKKVSNQKPRFSEFFHTWDWYIYLPGKVHLWKLSLIQEKCMVYILYVWYIYLHENHTLRIHTLPDSSRFDGPNPIPTIGL